MPKVSDIQSNFGGGEFSELVQGRVDLPRYKYGLASCQNYVSLLQGPVIRRAGTRYVAPTKNLNSNPRLLPFEFSTTQAYIIEFGNTYARFYKNNAAILLTPQNISGITQANPAVVTYVGADTYANGDEVEITGVVGMTQVNGRRFTVANVNVGANTFELQGVNSTGYTAYSSGGTVAEVYELSTPYTNGQFPYVQTVQSVDTLYIVHADHPPRKLTRTGHTSWTLTAIDFLDGPYLPINPTATTITLGATTGATTATASAPIFAATDEGRLIRWKDPANNWTWMQITGFTSTTVVNVTIRGPNASATTATVNWRLGLWSATTGYPVAIEFFGDRLWFGGAAVAAQRLDGSNVGDYENFAPTNAAGTVGDANACSFTLNSSDVQNIRWIKSDEKGLVVGTVKAEWVVRPSDQNEAITPTNVSAKPSTGHGSPTPLMTNGAAVVRAGKAIVFIQRAGRKLREFIYDLDQEGFNAPDLTQLAEHITKTGVIEIAYQQEPHSILWGIRSDGTLIGCTYQRDIDNLSVGWHQHVIGGKGLADGSEPNVEHIAVIPSADGTRDELWMVVSRYIGGQVVHYVEYMNKVFEQSDKPEFALCLDCAATYNTGAPASTIGGLWHLEGETISVHADGAILPNVTVTNGTVTISQASTVVNFGYTYNSDIKTLRPDSGAADGTAMGKTKRINRLGMFLWRTGGLFFGRDADNLDELIFREAGDDTNTAVPLYTGIKSETFSGDYDMNTQVYIRQNTPLPGAILGLYPMLHTQDR